MDLNCKLDENKCIPKDPMEGTHSKSVTDMDIEAGDLSSTTGGDLPFTTGAIEGEFLAWKGGITSSEMEKICLNHNVEECDKSNYCENQYHEEMRGHAYWAGHTCEPKSWVLEKIVEDDIAKSQCAGLDVLGCVYNESCINKLEAGERKCVPKGTPPPT